MGKQEVSALTDYSATTTSTSPPSPLPLPLISRFPRHLSLSPLLYNPLHPRFTIFPISPFSFSFSFRPFSVPRPLYLSQACELAMELHHHVNPYYLKANPISESGERDRDPDRDRDRLPQWTHAETKEFLAMRAELDQRFMETKRNKPLWQGISARLQQKGFIRTPEQCKSKWKNLVTRFKGSEATEGEGSRQFPFYEEMRMIFSERMVNKDKGKGVQVQGEEWGEEEEEEQEEEEKVGDSKKKRKVERKRGFEGEVENALREFARRQLEMEARWIEAAEAREVERRAKELEWRREMEALEEERKLMERRWREREEERRAREEARADRRDALVTALLAKLTKEEL